MTKRILILAYIVGVLLISGLASASQGRGLVVDATLHKTTTMLSIYGVYSNPCQTDPKIRATSIDYQNNIVNLAIETTQTSEICAEVLGDNFEIAYDLRQLPLKPGVIYNVKVSPAAQSNIEVSYLAQASETYGLYKNMIKKVPVLVEAFTHGF